MGKAAFGLRFSGAALAVLAFPAFTLPLACNPRSLTLESRIAHILRKYSVIGMSYAVIKGSDIVSSGTYGFADRERNIRTEAGTLFRIASCTKPITGTAVMQLVEKGRLRLDDDVSRYTGFYLRNPRYPGVPVTIKHLMTHTSGLEDTQEYSKDDCNYYCDDFIAAVRKPNPPPLQAVLLPGGKYYSRQVWGWSPPGKDFHYSNLAAGILASVVERVSGERFDLYCRRHIFQPLGITATYNVSELDNVDRVAVQYRYLKGLKEFEPAVDDYRGVRPLGLDYSRLKLGHNGLIFAPQGGVRTTIPGLAKFLAAQMNGGVYKGKRILSEASTALMQKVHWKGKEGGGLYSKYGLYVQTTDDIVPGRTLIGHKGIAYGALCDMYFDADARVGVVMAMNGGRYEVKRTAIFDVELEILPLLFDSAKD